MTSRILFLPVLTIILMGNSSFGAVRNVDFDRNGQRQRDDTQRQREERDRERRDSENRRPGPAPRPVPAPLPPASEPDMQIDIPSFAGNGCPQGSVATVLSPDNKALSLLFDQFIYDGSVPRNFTGNTSCQMQIPIRTVNGRYRMKVLAVDLRGFVQIDEPNVNGALRARSWIQSANGGGTIPRAWTVERQAYRGPISESIFLRLDGNAESRIYTGCSDSFILNVSAEINLSAGRAPARSGMIAIDSVDQDVQQGGLVYQLSWEACR